MAKASKGKPKKKAAVPALPGLLVNDARLQHGAVELESGPDVYGSIVAHARAVDTLSRFLRSGKISDSMYSAGRRFEELFARASLNSVRAANLSGAAKSSNRGSIIESIEDAKDRVHAALDSMGGASTPCGSALWFILGMGDTIEEWARRQAWGNGRSLNPAAAAGVLVGGIGALEAHFSRSQPRRILSAPITRK